MFVYIIGETPSYVKIQEDLEDYFDISFLFNALKYRDFLSEVVAVLIIFTLQDFFVQPLLELNLNIVQSFGDQYIIIKAN